MKKICFVILLLGLLTKTSIANNNMACATAGCFGFVAPSVADSSTVNPAETGQIIFDTVSQTFKGADSNGDFAELSKPVGQVKFLAAESQVKTPTATGVYMQLTDNKVTLPEGSWRLTGWANFASSGATSYSYVNLDWSLTNGADNATGPVAPTLDAGNKFTDRTVASLNAYRLNMTTVRITVAQDTDVFLVPFAFMATPANARVSVKIYAERVD